MGKSRRLVSIFFLNDLFAAKGTFLIPMYLGKYLGAKTEFVFPKSLNNSHFKDEYRGVKLTPLKSKSNPSGVLWSEKRMLWWLIRNASDIDVLGLYWISPRNIVFAKIYKMLNPQGACYIKGDFDEYAVLALPEKPDNNLKKKIKEWFLKAIDVLTVETTAALRHLESGALGRHISQIVKFVPNAFDEQLFKEYDIKIRDFEEKENLIITVGRIGHKEKNNEMMLDALDGIDMKEWKLVLIGPVEEDFKIKYRKFIECNPDKRDRVILQGPLFDKANLWDFYNRAKVFVLTSPREGFPNVFLEALYFGNYIITTNVSSVSDVTDCGRLGCVIDKSDTDMLRREFENVFDGKSDLKSYYPEIRKHAEKFVFEKTIVPIALKIQQIFESHNTNKSWYR